MKIGFGLLNGRFGPGDLRGLLAVVKASQNSALGYPITDIGAKLDQHAGNLEADLGCDARLDRSEAEDFNRHITLDGGDLYLDRAQSRAQTAKPTPATMTTDTTSQTARVRMVEAANRFQTMPSPTQQ